MSYDLRIRTPTCPHCSQPLPGSWEGDVTWNLSPIVERCIGHHGLTSIERSEVSDRYWKTGEGNYSWQRLHGHLVTDALPSLLELSERCSRRDPELVALEPTNGFGSVADLAQLAASLLEAALKAPAGSWIEVW